MQIFNRGAASAAAGTALVSVGLSSQSAAASPADITGINLRRADPRISEWVHAKTVRKETGWSNEYQGMCTDGRYWYIVTNEDTNGHKRLYKTTLDFTVIASIRAPAVADHIGSPTYDVSRGLVYVPIVPVQGYPAGKESAARIWQVAPTPGNIHTVGVVPLTNRDGSSWGPQQHEIPWCAWNPWDGLLYSSIGGNAGADAPFSRVSHFYGYDCQTGALRKRIALDGIFRRFQGGGFGRDGRNLYMVADHLHLSDGRKHIYAFDLSDPVDGGTAGYWGSRVNPAMAEAESIVWAHLTWRDARDTYVTLSVLDNDTDTDDVVFYHYGVPDPNAI